MRIIKLLAAIAFIAAGVLYWQLFIPSSESSEPIFIEIKSGEHFVDVAQNLKKNELIRNIPIFVLAGRVSGLDREVRAGRYKIDPLLNPIGILEFLTTPSHGEVSITIPEGSTIYDIDRRLTELGVIKKNDFVTFALSQNPPIEGYLFPDTYFIFAQGFDHADLAKKMRDNFEKKVGVGLAENLKSSKRTRSEIIIVASILEKEVRTQQDLAVVAGILWKRLDNDWPLQADATLLYGKEDRTLSAEDFADDSAYNTYTRTGLPAGPIGNPGIATIKAAAAPFESEHWFYLTTAEGEVIYAKTNEEHEKNKQKYLGR